MMPHLQSRRLSADGMPLWEYRLLQRRAVPALTWRNEENPDAGWTGSADRPLHPRPQMSLDSPSLRAAPFLWQPSFSPTSTPVASRCAVRIPVMQRRHLSRLRHRCPRGERFRGTMTAVRRITMTFSAVTLSQMTHPAIRWLPILQLDAPDPHRRASVPPRCLTATFAI